MRALWLIVVVGVAGCAAQMMTTPHKSGSLRNGPSNEAQLGGTVQYEGGGLQSIIEARRQDAYDKMAAACEGGAYRITSEKTTTLTVSVYGVPVPYVVIEFACNDGAATAEDTGPARRHGR